MNNESKQNLNNSYFLQETIQSIYPNESNQIQNNDIYQNIIPPETVKSIYPMNDTNNNKKNENLLSKISPGQIINSIHIKPLENNQLCEKANSTTLSNIIPNDTFISIYEGQNKKVNDIHY